jgi:hypothetical protein
MGKSMYMTGDLESSWDKVPCRRSQSIDMDLGFKETCSSQLSKEMQELLHPPSCQQQLVQVGS